MKNSSFIYLFLIMLFGFILRIWNIHWDAGFHLHPDERAIILFTLPLQLPATLQDFFSPMSPWNPHFFAYGSFPLYLLKFLTTVFGFFDMQFITYTGMPTIGRITSAVFDTATIFVLYFFTKKLFSSSSIALLASFFYAISVLPIQLSHFYAVDTILTFYILFTLYQLIRFYEHPTKRKAFGIGILCGFALATKTSASVLIISVLCTIGIDFVLVFLKHPHKMHIWKPHIPIFLRRLFVEGVLIIFGTTVAFFLLEPYAFIDAPEFIRQTLQQGEMTKSAFTFPYTLQYVGKISYVYELQNIILWGLGPLLGITMLVGVIFYTIQLCKGTFPAWQKHLIFLTFFWIYFLVVGNFAIGFMRYMLPLYPFFCLFAAYLVFMMFLLGKRISPRISSALLILFFTVLLIWPLSFMQIYQSSPTRVSATEWIHQNIPQGKTLAIEHWDDGLPLVGQENYTIETLELYNPESPEKWNNINEQLARTDYIILASNRLYVPLQKLTDCTTLPFHHCYPQTAEYYKDLFAGKRGFTLVKEFSVFPEIPFLNIPIIDSNADESFTVYDHPKVMIFKRTY